MTYPAGTRIIAESTMHVVEGILVDPVESFDDRFSVLCDDGETVVVNGWLWSVDVDTRDDGTFVGGSYMTHADYVREIAPAWCYPPDERVYEQGE